MDATAIKLPGLVCICGIKASASFCASVAAATSPAHNLEQLEFPESSRAHARTALKTRRPDSAFSCYRFASFLTGHHTLARQPFRLRDAKFG